MREDDKIRHAKIDAYYAAKKYQEIPVSVICEILDYRANTGKLYFHIPGLRRYHARVQTAAFAKSFVREGDRIMYPADAVSGETLVVQLFGRQIPSHVLAFAIKMGTWPEGRIRHLDGNRRNNAWNNLYFHPTKVKPPKPRIPTVNTRGLPRAAVHLPDSTKLGKYRNEH